MNWKFAVHLHSKFQICNGSYVSIFYKFTMGLTQAGQPQVLRLQSYHKQSNTVGNLTMRNSPIPSHLFHFGCYIALPSVAGQQVLTIWSSI